MLCLVSSEFIGYKSKYIDGRTDVQFGNTTEGHKKVVIFYNNEGFKMVTGSFIQKSCKRILWKRYNCKRSTKYEYDAIPKVLENKDHIIAKADNKMLKWMEFNVPESCQTFDYYMIKGNSKDSYIFDPSKLEKGKRHCMFFGSQTKHNFVVYKSNESFGNLLVENMNIPNTATKVTEETYTINGWNNLYLYYEPDEKDNKPIVGVKKFTTHDDYDFWSSKQNTKNVKEITQ